MMNSVLPSLIFSEFFFIQALTSAIHTQSYDFQGMIFKTIVINFISHLLVSLQYISLITVITLQSYFVLPFVDTGGEIIRCSNPDCDLQWLHLHCMKMTEVDLPVAGMDWYCSERCRASKKSMYCICQKRIEGTPQVTCFSGADRCKGGVVFHTICVARQQPNS